MPFKRFIEGYTNFHKDYFRSDDPLYKTLVEEGQKPETLVIACSDSRTDPANVINSRPGDLFMVRNVAAIVPPYHCDSQHHGTSAAIEFAVRSLKIKHIVVMGHSLCGGIGALANLEEFRSQYEFLPQWMDIGRPALDFIKEKMGILPPEQQQRALEQAVILVSLNNLMTFPWIKEGIDSKTLDLHGWYFDIRNGQLLSYDAQTGTFNPIQKTTEKYDFS